MRAVIDPDDVASLHADGLVDQEIADELGCSLGGVHGVRKRLGLPPNGAGGRGRRGATSGRRAGEDVGLPAVVLTGATELTLDEKVDAICAQVDGDLWYPDRGDRAGANTAKQLCHTCPIQRRCAEVAIATGEPHGIWGGLTARERRLIAQRQEVAA